MVSLQDLLFLVLGFRTTKDVKKGAELITDYGSEYWEESLASCAQISSKWGPFSINSRSNFQHLQHIHISLYLVTSSDSFPKTKHADRETLVTSCGLDVWFVFFSLPFLRGLRRLLRAELPSCKTSNMASEL